MADTKRIFDIVKERIKIEEAIADTKERYKETLKRLADELSIVQAECKHWETHIENSTEGDYKVCDVCGFEFPHNLKDKITLE